MKLRSWFPAAKATVVPTARSGRGVEREALREEQQEGLRRHACTFSTSARCSAPLQLTECCSSGQSSRGGHAGCTLHQRGKSRKAGPLTRSRRRCRRCRQVGWQAWWCISAIRSAIANLLCARSKGRRSGCTQRDLRTRTGGPPAQGAQRGTHHEEGAALPMPGAGERGTGSG